ncbi:hypothetical protein [uncultured Nostoc sp.]|uniref:hypothetical protein n=1 Tax=uncultured Nostoc sp. TaxID=340711 RepID=UPI0035CB3B53
MAIYMLKKAQSDVECDRNLSILQQEYAREIMFLNEMKNLQTLLTPENAKVLQNFNLLNYSKYYSFTKNIFKYFSVCT